MLLLENLESLTSWKLGGNSWPSGGNRENSGVGNTEEDLAVIDFDNTLVVAALDVFVVVARTNDKFDVISLNVSLSAKIQE